MAYDSDSCQPRFCTSHLTEARTQEEVKEVIGRATGSPLWSLSAPGTSGRWLFIRAALASALTLLHATVIYLAADYCIGITLAESF